MAAPSTGDAVESTRLETVVQVSKPEATEPGPESADPDEAGLEAKMLAAADAGRHTLSLAYERPLEALRSAKRAGNVTRIEDARKRRG
jgi:hypothetical protein